MMNCWSEKMSWMSVLKMHPATKLVRADIHAETKRQFEEGSFSSVVSWHQQYPTLSLEEIKEKMREKIEWAWEQMIIPAKWLVDNESKLTEKGWTEDDIDWEEVKVADLGLADKYLDSLRINNGVYEYDL